jgi:hypothetical protein
LLLSPFSEKDKRVTVELAAERNRFVAAISDEILFPYAHPGSKTEALALDVLASAKRVYIFPDRPGPLLSGGAVLVSPEALAVRSAPAAAGRGHQQFPSSPTDLLLRES